MKQTSRSGLTMIEVMIAGAILSAVILVTLTIMVRVSNDAQTARVDDHNSFRAQELLSRVRREIEFAKLKEILNNHTTLRFQIPVDHDGDGDVTDAGGATEFGYFNVASQQTLNAACELTTEVEFVMRETNGPTLSLGVQEQLYDMDLNRDGDTTDVFVSVRLKMQIQDAGGVATFVAYIDGGLLLAPKPSALTQYDGDVDGDGVNDPLFLVADYSGGEVLNAQISQAARRLAIRSFHGGFASDGRIFMLRKNVDLIRLDQKQ